jgi:putative ABC transport system substrate-binding protein
MRRWTTRACRFSPPSSFGQGPTRNLTGVADRYPELAAKMMETLKAVMPGLARFAILGPGNLPGSNEFTRYFEEAVAGVGVEPVSTFVSSREELIGAFESMPARGIGAAWHWYGNGFLDREPLAQLALAHRVALGDFVPGIVEAGGLLSYSASLADRDRLLARQLDKILRGTPVRDVPFQLPTNLWLEINRKTAAALGLSIPAHVLVRADRVYD